MVQYFKLFMIAFKPSNVFSLDRLRLTLFFKMPSEIGQRVYANEYCEHHMYPSFDGQTEMTVDL